MIYLNAGVNIPWWKREFKTVRFWHGSCSKHKVWEVQVVKYNSLFSLELRVSTREDHAGMSFGFGVLGFEVILNLYDTRHWDDEAQKWCSNGDDE